MNYELEGRRILIIDPSSEHIGFAIMSCVGDSATIEKAGMLYASSSWDLGRKLHYMYHSIKYLVQHFQVNLIITEMFEMPKFRQMGISVIPTINNNLKMLSYEITSETGGTLDVLEWPISSWRKNLSISWVPAKKASGELIMTPKGNYKQDWKIPAKAKVEEFLKLKIPDQLLANSDLKLRKTPYDLSDCLAISIAYAIKNHYPIIKADLKIFENDHIMKILYTMRKKV